VANQRHRQRSVLRSPELIPNPERLDTGIRPRRIYVNTKPTALAVVGALCLVSTSALADQITIDQALARASQRPSVRLAALDVDIARANARGAALPLANPELTIVGGPQLGGNSLAFEVQIGLAQTFERGGKRSARTRVADADAHTTDMVRGRELLAARVEVWRAFEQALVARDRVATRREVEQLATALATAMQQTARAGGTTTLRVNVLVADAGRARQERLAAESELATALAHLSTAIGARPGEILDPAGALDDLRATPPSVEDVVAITLRAHPEVAIGDAELAAARARIDSADARGAVDVTLGLGYAYAPDPDGAHAILGTIAIPLAVRNRNQGERAVARIGVHRAEVERQYERDELERRVRLAYENYRRAREAVAGFDSTVTDRLNENLKAAQEAFTKGGLDFVELTTTQRELIAGRVAFLAARATAIDAWAELAQASGSEVRP
jgi:cobalt-zinc-cadmium efflux system outer membrane protein